MKILQNLLTGLKKIFKKSVLVIAGVIVLAAAIVVAIAAFANNKNKSTDNTNEVEDVTAEAQMAEAVDVLPLTPDGPMFPELDMVVPTTEPIPPTLRLGDQHWVVQNIQERLMELGFMDFDEPTDYFGEATQAAVMKFQRQHELDQDGIVGESTLALILSDEAKYYAAKENDDGEDITQIQQRLYQLGYLASEDQITGHFGEKTKEAVLKLQERNNLSMDGTVGRETYNLIYSDEVRPNLLVFGDKSDVVLKCQQRLFNLGYMTTQPDGIYGADMSAALKTFQMKNALVVDGYLGPETRDILMSSSALPNHMGIGDTSEQVTNVQKKLVKLGYLSNGRATGYFGEITQKAVKNFQKQNGLSQDGMVGAQTLAKLTSEGAKKAASGMLDGANFRSNSGGGSSSGGGSGSGGGSSSGGSGTDAGSTSQTTGGSSTPNTDASGVSGEVANLLAVARSKIGCPYVWGAKGPNSFDCSGFVHWVLNQCGVGQSYITSSGWRSVGRYTRISNYSDLRAGDVIVVNGHVGFVSTGGCIIDASSSNGRVIERGLGSWWANHFIVGWRIF